MSWQQSCIDMCGQYFYLRTQYRLQGNNYVMIYMVRYLISNFTKGQISLKVIITVTYKCMIEFVHVMAALL